MCWGSSSGSVLPTMTPNDQNNLDRKPLNFLILVVLPRKLTCPLQINSSYVSFRGCACFRCLLRLGLILSWLEQARNTRTHFSSCEISILGSWCPFHFGWLDSDPAFFWSCFFFGTTSTSEEIYVFFPAILGIFNVFFGNHEAFPQQMFIGLSLDLSPKNSWRLLLKGTLRTSLDCSCWKAETVRMGILSDSPLIMHWISMLTLK